MVLPSTGLRTGVIEVKEGTLTAGTMTTVPASLAGSMRGISRCMAIVVGLAYQTSVLNNRFEQIEKGWEESDKKFAERSKLSEENLKTHLEQSERNRTARFGNLKQEVRAQRK